MYSPAAFNSFASTVEEGATGPRVVAQFEEALRARAGRPRDCAQASRVSPRQRHAAEDQEHADEHGDRDRLLQHEEDVRGLSPSMVHSGKI